MKEFFPSIPYVKYEGRDTENPMAFRYYNPDEVIAGKPMREHLKFAMAYWHNMSAEGTDMFGVGTSVKNYGSADPMKSAINKAHAAMELMDKLDIYGLMSLVITCDEIKKKFKKFQRILRSVTE